MVCFLVFACFWPSLPGIRPVYDGVLASLMNCVYLSKKKKSNQKMWCHHTPQVFIESIRIEFSLELKAAVTHFSSFKPSFSVMGSSPYYARILLDATKRNKASLEIKNLQWLGTCNLWMARV